MGQLTLALEEALFESLDPAGALLQAAAERVDLVLGVSQLRSQGLGLDGEVVGVRGIAHCIYPSPGVGAVSPHASCGAGQGRSWASRVPWTPWNGLEGPDEPLTNP